MALLEGSSLRKTVVEERTRVVQHSMVPGGEIVFLLIHLLFPNDLLGNLESLSGASFVYIGGVFGRYDSSIKTPITSSGGSNVGPLLVL